MAETLRRTFDQEMSVRWRRYSMVDLLENNWTNPFGNDPSDVGSISTGTVVSPDSLAACEKREYAYKEFKHQKIVNTTMPSVHALLTTRKLNKISYTKQAGMLNKLWICFLVVATCSVSRLWHCQSSNINYPFDVTKGQAGVDCAHMFLVEHSNISLRRHIIAMNLARIRGFINFNLYKNY